MEFHPAEERGGGLDVTHLVHAPAALACCERALASGGSLQPWQAGAWSPGAGGCRARLAPLVVQAGGAAGVLEVAV